MRSLSQILLFLSGLKITNCIDKEGVVTKRDLRNRTLESQK